MRPCIAVLASFTVLCLSAGALLAEPADLEEQPLALEADAQSLDETPTARKPAAPPREGPAREAAAPRWMEHLKAAGPAGPQAILAALRDPAAAGCLAVAKLRSMVANERTRHPAVAALENLAGECPNPVIQRAALLVLAEVYVDQGQGEKAARALIRVCKTGQSPAAGKFGGPFPTAPAMHHPPMPAGPCPHCGQMMHPFSGGASPASPAAPPPAVERGEPAFRPTPHYRHEEPQPQKPEPPAARAEARAEARAGAQIDGAALREPIEQRQNQLRELSQQVSQKEKYLRELNGLLEAKAKERALAEQELRAKAAQIRSLSREADELRTVIADLQRQIDKSKAAGALQTQVGQQDLQAQRAKLEAQTKNLRQWEMRLRQWEQKLKEAQAGQNRQEQQEEEE